MSDNTIPTLSAWTGGLAALTELARRFYEKVPDDPVLGLVFAGMDPAHARHVAAFIDEVFGGPTAYTDGGGTHHAMILKHMGRGLTEAQRQRWIALMLETVDQAGLPADPEFRAALVGYLEWGTRLAVINSAPGAAPPAEDAPMPVWGWGPPGGPYLG
ncbi:MAG: globin [Caulobacteraceae bacterium]|nr:group II truncated hemoglobin [Caulobacter sp.]RYF92326.1 MAG: globin [Caulobacteraceae bacterium]